MVVLFKNLVQQRKENRHSNEIVYVLFVYTHSILQKESLFEIYIVCTKINSIWSNTCLKSVANHFSNSILSIHWGVFMSPWVCCILVNCRVIWVLPLQNQHFARNHHLEGCELFDQQRELFLKLLISQTNIFDGDEVLSYKNGHKLYYFQRIARAK